MNRRHFLQTLGAGVAVAACPPLAAEVAAPKLMSGSLVMVEGFTITEIAPVVDAAFLSRYAAEVMDRIVNPPVICNDGETCFMRITPNYSELLLKELRG